MPDEVLLRVKHLRTFFNTKTGVLPAVNDVSFELRGREILGVVGESGCGKSVMSMSILKLIEKYGGKVQPDSSVELMGRQVLSLPEKVMCDLRGKEIAMISQDPMTSLNPVYTVEKQMVEMICRHTKMNKKQASAHALSWLKRVGIPEAEKRLKEYPYQLSGGMCQRVIIAMALSCSPKVLIADEPTTALDVTIQAQILDLLRKLRDDVGAAIILVTHDMGVVAGMADNIMVMYAGRCVEYGTKHQIFKSPKHPYTQGLLASVPRMDKQEDKLYAIPGNVPNLTQKIEGCVFRDRCSKCIGKCAKEAPPEYLLDEGQKVSCWLYEGVGKEVPNE